MSTDDELPSGADILSMQHPAELFGTDLSDARALRRRWSRIARAFRDTEPTVFQHARELFERARDADASEPNHPSPPAFSLDSLGRSDGVQDLDDDAVPPVIPAPTGVAQWVYRRDHAALARVVELDPGAIAGQASMREVLMIVVMGGAPDLTDSQVLAVKRELNHELLDISPAEEAKLKRGLEQAQSLREMVSDASIPEALRELVLSCWSPSPRRFVDAMDRFTSSGTPESHTDALLGLPPVLWEVIVGATKYLAAQCPREGSAVTVPPALVKVVAADAGLPPVLFFVVFMASVVFASLAMMALSILLVGRVPAGEQDPLLAPLFLASSIPIGLTLVMGWLVDLQLKQQGVEARARGIRELGLEFALFPVEVCRAIRAAVGRHTRGPEVERLLEQTVMTPGVFLELWSPQLIERLLAVEC